MPRWPNFNDLLASHPDYTNGYFMAAQTLARADRNDEARAMLQQGIESLAAPAISMRRLKWKACWMNWTAPEPANRLVQILLR